MKPRRCVLLVALIIVASSCGDGGPNLPTQNESWLVQFKRVTLASETPDRLEIEIVVRTGSDFSEPARDGTKVAVGTSHSEFEAQLCNCSICSMTSYLHLIVPAAVDEHGSMRLASS
jgi:hypothetical protein